MSVLKIHKWTKVSIHARIMTVHLLLDKMAFEQLERQISSPKSKQIIINEFKLFPTNYINTVRAICSFLLS